MRIDPARVLELAGSLNEPRLANTPGETRAAELIARELTRAGWWVERLPVRPFWRLRVLDPLLRLGLLVFGWFAFAMNQAFPDGPRSVRWGLPALITLSIGASILVRVKRDRALEAANPSANVIGTVSKGTKSKSRIIVITYLRNQGSGWLFLLLFAVFALLGFFCRLCFAGRSRHPQAFLWGFPLAMAALTVQWLCLVVLGIGWRERPVRPINGHNRTGLALLLELARVWPRGVRERVETWMIAFVGYDDLLRQLRPRLSDGKPTLVIGLFAPGVGPEVEIIGRGKGLELAVEAARSLWIPYRRIRSTAREDKLVAHWFWQRKRGHAVNLGGKPADQPIDSEALKRVADLVVELALRWGKSTSGPGDSP